MILKKTFLYLVYIAVFLLALLLFIPKLNLYYAFEKEIKKSQLVISNETLKEDLLSLIISDIDIYLQDQKLGFIKRVKLQYSIYPHLGIDITLVFNSKSYRGRVDLFSRQIIFDKIDSIELKELLKKLKFKNKNGVYLYEY